MPLLYVAFREGFDNDRVFAKVNGADAFDQVLRTKTQIGFAGQFELEKDPGAIRLDVELPDRNQKKSIDLTLEQSPVFVGVNRNRDGNLAFQTSTEPFRYM